MTRKRDGNDFPSGIPLLESNHPSSWLISAIVVLASVALLFPFYS